MELLTNKSSGCGITAPLILGPLIRDSCPYYVVIMFIEGGMRLP
jgi:hypothetical protein